MQTNESAFTFSSRDWNHRRAKEHLGKIAKGEVKLGAKARYTLEAIQDGANLPVKHVVEAIGADSFVAITIDKAHNALIEGSSAVPRSYSEVVRKGSASDFKAYNISHRGGRGSLPVVTEKQTYTEVNVTDELRQSITLQKYGEIWSFSMEALLNDEMGALTSYAQEEGAAWIRTLNSEIFGSNNLQNSGNIYDSTALFTSGHGNMLTAGMNSLNAANVKRAIALMMAQTGINSELLYLAPQILIVGPKLAIDAQELLASATYQMVNFPAASATFEPSDGGLIAGEFTSNSGRVGDVNLVRQYLSKLVVDPAITGTQWYICANPATNPWIQMNFLNGSEEAEIIAEPMNTGGAFERDAQRYKIRGAMAAEVVDFRSIVRGSDT